jgi:hypothetical protein
MNNVSEYLRSRVHKAAVNKVWESTGFTLVQVAFIMVGIVLILTHMVLPHLPESAKAGDTGPVLWIIGTVLLVPGLFMLAVFLRYQFRPVPREHDALRAAGAPQKFVGYILYNKDLEQAITGSSKRAVSHYFNPPYHKTVKIDYLASYRMHARISVATKGIKEYESAYNIAAALLLGFSEEDIKTYDARRLVELCVSGVSRDVALLAVREGIDIALVHSFASGQFLGLRAA